MTITPEATTEVLKAAIRNAFDTWEDRQEAAPGLDVEWVVDRVHAAVHAALGPIVAQAVELALNDPSFQNVIIEKVLVPVLGEIEDEINDDHDKPSTADMYRPGLRRAARTIRDTRRAATEEAGQP